MQLSLVVAPAGRISSNKGGGKQTGAAACSPFAPAAMTTRNELTTVNKEKKKNSGRSCDFPQALVVVVVVCNLNKEKNILKTPQFLLFSLMMMMMTQTPSSLTKNPNPLQQQKKGKNMQRKQALKCSAAILSSSDSKRDTASLSLSLPADDDAQYKLFPKTGSNTYAA
jgi:hypothetical protein